jgi:hypothetical protein
MFSINHKRLFGARDRTDNNFDNLGYISTFHQGRNLGSLIDVETYQVTAGIPVVAKELFNNNYRLINTMTVKNPERDINPQAPMELSVYNLKDYDKSWGWRLSFPDNEEFFHYYDFFEFIPGLSQEVMLDESNNKSIPGVDLTNYPDETINQSDGVIEWDNPMTTLSETVSGIKIWSNPDNVSDISVDRMYGQTVVEKIIEGKLRKGLELNE